VASPHPRQHASEPLDRGSLEQGDLALAFRTRNEIGQVSERSSSITRVIHRLGDRLGFLQVRSRGGAAHQAENRGPRLIGGELDVADFLQGAERIGR
jgi:hypothetical protein